MNYLPNIGSRKFSKIKKNIILETLKIFKILKTFFFLIYKLKKELKIFKKNKC